MNQIFDFLFAQYSEYETTDIILEIIAVIFGFLSVWFSKQNKVLVFPTGMISTVIFVYLLLKWELLGDMMINGYYFIMSVYGWYIWTRKVNDVHVSPISFTTLKEKKISIGIFIATLAFVFFVYKTFDKWTSWVAYVDTITTAIFFVAREYLQKKWDEEQKICEPKDLLPIAIGQMKLENEYALKANKLLICDTDLLETKVYSEVYYKGNCDPILEKYANKNEYDLYFLTYIDTPWEADDLRDKPNEREHMFVAFEKALKDFKKPYVLLKGDKEKRFKEAVFHINKLLNI